MNATPAAITDEYVSINIHWFKHLSNLLGKYLAVLRYELEQVKDEQTVEALIHAEIAKMLIREFPPNCVTTEYHIGPLFARKKNAEGEEYDRRFRADVALFHPGALTPDVDPDARPMAVFELKRQGSAQDLWDDIYRLTVVSVAKGATGYFIFAGPRDHVQKSMDSVPILKKLQDDQDSTHTFECSVLSESSLYAPADLKGKERFYGKLMHLGANESKDDPYDLRIFAFHYKHGHVAKRLGQRVELAVKAQGHIDDDPNTQETPLPESPAPAPRALTKDA